MVVKLLLIVAASAGAAWLAARAWPRVRTAFRGRLLPLLLSPIAFQLLRRIVWTLVRLLLFRR